MCQSAIVELQRIPGSHLRLRATGGAWQVWTNAAIVPPRQDAMPTIEHLAPDRYRRLPWKNGRGELVLIDGEGTGSWQDMGVAWHFGRTAIVEEGPFSDYRGYERQQVVIKGSGLVLVAPDHEIELRNPLEPRRYDGGTPIRTRLENGPVEVVNLIADRARFDIDLRVGRPGTKLGYSPGRHVVLAATGAARVNVDRTACNLPDEHALRFDAGEQGAIQILEGIVLLGSVCDKT